MIEPQLESLVITDFRSISGSVTIPLESPVILIHGTNGAGKTSVVSALELALTGSLETMRRADPSYKSHLLRRGARAGAISAAVRGLERGAPSLAQLSVTSMGVGGTALLHGEARRFFSERCYLAQATLSRLLDIYQASTSREDSPLTQFVKDLLGLDALDSLIEGLHPAGDLRNTRRLAPEYTVSQRARDDFAKRLDESHREIGQQSERISSLHAAISRAVSSLPAADGVEPPHLDDLDGIEAFLGTALEESRLTALAGYKRDLLSLRNRWTALAGSPIASEQNIAETEGRAAGTDLERWMQTTGQRLTETIDSLRDIFPDLPGVSSTDPQLALKTAQRRVETELERCQTVLTRDDEIHNDIGSHEQSIEHGKSRLARLDEELVQLAGDADEFSKALAGLVPFIRSEECPVCGRDFTQVSPEPLISFVATRAARIAEQAQRFQQLTSLRAETTSLLTAAERQLATSTRELLQQDQRTALKARIAELAEKQATLTRLEDDAPVGASIIRRESIARGRLAELRRRDADLELIQNALAELTARLEQQPPQPGEGISEVLHRLETQVHRLESELAPYAARRREALGQCRLLRQYQSDADLSEQAFLRARDTKKRLDDAYREAEARRAIARTLSHAAADTRASIIARVFNESLNALWRDLFVRLAPSEPFIPAFTVPADAAGWAVAQLETIYVSGGVGGSPAAMLSAGNLNTAALTLFLALHLSIPPQLPWLVLDDPVQSMDEVHVSQFAALLRTLSKRHDRQILITVHDRTLFDYLILELSPSFPGDRLITVELNRSRDGVTTAEPNFYSFEPDRAVAA